MCSPAGLRRWTFFDPSWVFLEIPYVGKEGGVVDNHGKTLWGVFSNETAPAVRTARKLKVELRTDCGTVRRVALHTGYGAETVRSLVRQAEIADLLTGGVTSEGVAPI